MDPNTILKEEVTFIQHHLPGLLAGSYQLEMSQSLTDKRGSTINEGDQLGKTYQFAVKGDRFRVKEPSKVFYAQFPPPNASGEYTTVLPHVVFHQKTFPWIRFPNNSEPEFRTQLKAGKVVDNDIPTWLGILLLDEDDQAAFPALSSLSVSTRRIKELVTTDTTVSYFKDNVHLEPGETEDDLLQAIDIPIGLFWKVAPSLADLNYLAHARKVNFLNKATIPGKTDQGEPVGDFSVVFGNRLPQTKVKSHAYLVSLEGLEDYLPTEKGAPAALAADKDKLIRLAVLKSWSFYSTGEAATFTDTLQALNGQSTDTNQLPEIATLRVPYHGTDQRVKDALQMGYVPLDHQLRTGENTVSWMRGPLAPYPVNKARIDFPVSSPDHATFFDPNSGLFDVSYAAAWTLGRLLGLQAKDFSTKLYTWKKDTANQLLALIEDALIRERFADILQVETQLDGLKGKEKTLSSEELYTKTLQLILDKL